MFTVYAMDGPATSLFSELRRSTDIEQADADMLMLKSTCIDTKPMDIIEIEG